MSYDFHKEAHSSKLMASLAAAEGRPMGFTPEFERVVSEAVTKALNEAAKEFASDEFSKAIKK